MKKSEICKLTIISLFIVSCEDVYNANLHMANNATVVDAQIVYGSEDNVVKIYQSKNFNDNYSGFPVLTGAVVKMVDSNGGEHTLQENLPGNFKVNFDINPELQYKIIVQYANNTFESSFEAVPEVPDIDSLYIEEETQVVDVGGVNNVSEFQKTEGGQMYVDITCDSINPYYRFSGRKVLQYLYTTNAIVKNINQEVTVFAWRSKYPDGGFILAQPPIYSSSLIIKKQPVFFIEKKPALGPTNTFKGWIVIMEQFGLSQTSYNYYNDLNSQLISDGKIFDPLYVQARNNLTCTNNVDELVLGNFEISSVKERRYFVKFISEKKGYLIKPIPYFYDIPASGSEMITPPDFWEDELKVYP